MTDIERDLVEQWKATDSIYEKRRICNKYLSRRIAFVEKIIATESIDDYDLDELLCELYSDLVMAQEQIKLDYPQRII